MEQLLYSWSLIANQKARNTIVGAENLKIGYLFADIFCSKTRTVFRERSSRKTTSLKEQIVFTILQIFLNTGAQFWRPFSENYLTSKQLCRRSKYFLSIQNVQFYLSEQFSRDKN